MRKSVYLAWLGLGLALASAGAAAQTVTGSGTAGKVPVFTGTSTIGNSPNITAQQIGPIYQVDQFSGATLAEKWNACNNALYAAGGGTCDARNMAGYQSPDAQMFVGSAATISVSSFTGSSGTLTFTTATQNPQFVAGNSVTLSGFASPNIGLNGQSITVLSAGLSSTSFEAVVTGSSYSSGTGAVSVGQNLSNGVTFILPTAGFWIWNLNNSASCGIRQTFGSTLIGFNTGADSQLVLETAGSSTNMDSLYCTDSGASIGNAMFIRAEGFTASNSAGTLANGVFHIQNLVDEASFSYMAGNNRTGDVWDIDGACCGDSFDHISGGISGTTQGGYPLNIASATTGPVKFTNSTFNGAPLGKNNIFIASGAGNVTFDNVYAEKYISNTNPMVEVSSGTGNISFNNTILTPSGSPVGQIGFENDSAFGPFAVTNSYVNQLFGEVTSINDVGASRVWSPPGGAISSYSSYYGTTGYSSNFHSQETSNGFNLYTPNSVSVPAYVQAVSFTPATTGWYTLLNCGQYVHCEGEADISVTNNAGLQTNLSVDFAAVSDGTPPVSVRLNDQRGTGIIDQVASYTPGGGACGGACGYLAIHVSSVGSPYTFAITSFTGASGTLTFTTAAQGLATGYSVPLSGFTGVNTGLNGQTVTVLSTGLNSTTFEAVVTGGGYSSGSGLGGDLPAISVAFRGQDIGLSGIVAVPVSSSAPSGTICNVNLGSLPSGTSFASCNNISASTVSLGSSGTAPAVGTPTVGQAACIKAAGPPVVIGYCSSVVSSGGACTCN